jgi:flagellar basal body-associated protein FliL
VKKLLKNKKILAIPIVILLVCGVGYKFFLAPKPVPPVLKVEGTVVPLAEEFLVNLAEGRFAKVKVAVIIDAAHAGGAAHGAAGEAPVLAQEAVIRAIVTDELTGAPAEELVDRPHRKKLLDKLAKAMHEETDEHVEEVLFTDIAVQ